MRNGPGQRTGRGRPLLAVRLRGRRAVPEPVVLPDHGLRRRTPRLLRQAARLARAGPDDAEELDREELRLRGRLPHGRRHGRDQGLHDAPGHDLRRHLHARRRGAPPGPGTRPGKGLRREGPGLRGEDQEAGQEDADLRVLRKGGRLPRFLLPEPRHGAEDADLRRQLRPGRLRHRLRHGRADPRPARFRIRQEVRSAAHRRHPAAGPGLWTCRP